MRDLPIFVQKTRLRLVILSKNWLERLKISLNISENMMKKGRPWKQKCEIMNFRSRNLTRNVNTWLASSKSHSRCCKILKVLIRPSKIKIVIKKKKLVK